jgi:hypothetical protein
MDMSDLKYFFDPVDLGFLMIGRIVGDWCIERLEKHYVVSQPGLGRPGKDSGGYRGRTSNHPVRDFSDPLIRGAHIVNSKSIISRIWSRHHAHLQMLIRGDLAADFDINDNMFGIGSCPHVQRSCDRRGDTRVHKHVCDIFREVIL